MYKYVITLSFILSCAWCAAEPKQLKCGDDEFNLDEVRCCKKCDPAWGVISDCRYDNNTQCSPCKPGTFSAKSSHTERCRQCTICGSNAKQIATCNLSQDTICECDAGLYFNLTTRKCQACTICDAGHGAIRQCSKNQDTSCAQCINGTTYSDIASSSAKCLTCSQCTDGHVTLRNCTTSEDSLCFSMDLSPGKPTNGADDSDNAEESSNTGAELIPLYCAIMGLIVAALLAYVIYKQWKIRGKKRRAQYVEAEKGYVTTGGTTAVGKKAGSDSGVYVDDFRYPVGAKRYSELSSSVKHEVEKAIMTGDQNCWMKLAKHLGCPRERISAIETQSQVDTQTNPINIVLTEWAIREGATVGILMKALRHVSRPDVIRILQGDRNSPQAV